MTDLLASSTNKSAKSESVKVVVRSRPMTEKEISSGYKQIVEMNTEQGVIELHPPNASSNQPPANLTGSFLQSNGKSTNAVGSNNTNETIKRFTFDAVFDANSKQSDIYDQIMRPIVDSVLEGYNCTVFAYGQTGTGKTYTMEGISTDKERKGIIPNSFSHIFNHIARTTDKQYLVRASYLEIYQEQIRDLLIKDQGKRLELKEKPDIGVVVDGLSSIDCKSIKEIEHVMHIGNKNRSVGATNMNERSSRSHAIFIITIEHSDVLRSSQSGSQRKLAAAGGRAKSRTRLPGAAVNGNEEASSQNNEDLLSSTDEIREDDSLNSSTDKDLAIIKPITGHIRVGKLNLVDLAGSERQYKTGTTGVRQKEAIKINLSLSALGNVISSLVDSKSTHIPYRDSYVSTLGLIHRCTLTRLLQDSLGGNSKTVMIANIGPANYNYDETLTTLRYANRAKNIKNKPRINEDPKDAKLKQLQQEIEKLRTLLTQRKKSGVQRNRSALSTLSNEDSLTGSLTGELANYDSEKLAERIRQMESKLLCGGRNIVDHTNDQQRELERKAQLIAAQKQKEREIKQKLDEQEENTLEIKETFTSLRQEVELKKRKLKKLFFKLQLVKSEIKDAEEANVTDSQDLEEYQYDLMKELKFKYLVIENFVPFEEKNKLLWRIEYDDELEDWQFKSVDLIDSKSVRKQEQIKLNQTRLQEQSDRNQELSASLSSSMISSNLTNPNLKCLPITLRFKMDNNLILNLIEPIDTVKAYKMPSLSPTIQAAIDSALDVDSEILIDASPNSNKPEWMRDCLKSGRHQRSKQTESQTGNSHLDHSVGRINNDVKYPKALGLIKR